MLVITLILVSTLAFIALLYFSTKAIKSKATKTKLNIERTTIIKDSKELNLNKNQIIEEKIDENFISIDRINSIKEKFKSTQNPEISIKKSTKEDVEKFYKSQSDTIDDDRKIQK